ncbi:MAG: hypothetical protein LLG20_22750 [Acidobacteriales bacterium]|nr:hypothetical protein [Terriglobales bacterium]
MSTELATAPVANTAALSMFANAELFALVQRQAQLIATSDLIPKQFQGNVANCAIALEMASRLGASPFAVIQNLDVIHGRPSWRSTFLMGMINACGRFTPLQFKVEETGKPRTVELEIERWEGPQGARKKTTVKRPWTYTPTTCIAYARYKATGEEVTGPPVSYDMALEEGWVAKDGSKWLTELRELMLRYRAASFFAKVHASDLTLGMQTAEEAHDITPMRDVTPREEAATPPAPKGNPYADPAPAAEAAPVEVEQPKKATRAKKPAPAAEAAPPAEEPAVDRPNRTDMVADIKESWREAEITMSAAEAKYKAAGLIGPDEKLSTITTDKLFEIWKVRGAVLRGEIQPEGDAQ